MIFSALYHHLSTYFNGNFNVFHYQLCNLLERAAGSPFKFLRCATRPGSLFKFFKVSPCAAPDRRDCGAYCGPPVGTGSTVRAQTVRHSSFQGAWPGRPPCAGLARPDRHWRWQHFESADGSPLVNLLSSNCGRQAANRRECRQFIELNISHMSFPLHFATLLCSQIKIILSLLGNVFDTKTKNSIISDSSSGPWEF